MTLSASHTVQFLKAIEVGMPSPDGHQADLPKSNPCWSCIQEGWRWVVIHSDMEESMPTLASWIQMGCNSSNSIGRPQSELELATTISKFFEGGLDLQQAIQRAKQGDIKCQGSLPSVALYVQRFSGGANFPLLAWLTKFSQQYGSTLLLGAEFAHALANLDFKVPGQLFPMIRLAAWATQLTSTHKSADGYARMLSKGDLEKLKNNH